MLSLDLTFVATFPSINLGSSEARSSESSSSAAAHLVGATATSWFSVVKFYSVRMATFVDCHDANFRLISLLFLFPAAPPVNALAARRRRSPHLAPGCDGERLERGSATG